MPIPPTRSSVVADHLDRARSTWRMPRERWERATEAALAIERAFADDDPAALDRAAGWLRLCGPVRDFDGGLPEPSPDVVATEEFQIIIARILDRVVDHDGGERPESAAPGA